MKIVCTADFHGEFPQTWPDGDVLVVAGDLLPVWDHNRQFQSRWITSTLLPHLQTLPYERVICIAGNHDFVFQESGKFDKLFKDKLIYLRDESYVYNGVNFHGSPWSPKFGSWAFMMTDPMLFDKWQKIPDNTDVLIVHGPPFGACDKVFYGSENVGSKTLRQRIVDLDLKLVVTGHIHEGYGIDKIDQTIVANVSHRDVDYRPVNEPMVFDI